MKKILPSARQKKRYLAYEIVTDNYVKYEEVKKTIDLSLERFLGVLGLSISKPVVMPLFDGRRGIIKLANNYLNEVKLGILLIKEINGKKVIFKNIHVSGILKKAKRFLKGGCSYATNQSKSGNGV